jgi:uncharacterized protein
MSEEQPHLIDPLRLAHQHRLVHGKFPLATMTRVCESLCATEGDVSFELMFSLDESHRPMIRGGIKTALPMICQRCLQPLRWEIDAPVTLMILSDEADEENLPDDVDALTLHSTTVSLQELVENELILAIPLVPKHDVCPQNEYRLAGDAEVHDPNPFAILKGLKKN